MNAQPGSLVAEVMEGARAAQPGWAATALGERLAVIRRLRRRLAGESRALAASIARPGMDEGQLLLAEVMPLLAACRFLEREAGGLLKPRRLPGGRPAWLWGTRLVVRRVPFGLVLVVGPGNYPLMLPGIQALQALAAGNAVAVKPAPGWGAPMRQLGEALGRAGLPAGLFAVLPDSHAAGEAALDGGADKVVLTGGGATGRAVLSRLAATLTPATMELSGHDAVIVLPGADPVLVARVVAHGLALNGGQTCIAPRRILAVRPLDEALAVELARLLPGLPACRLPEREAAAMRAAVAQGEAAGGVSLGGVGAGGVVVLRVPAPEALPAPVFAPLAGLAGVADAEAAVALANSETHALGAAVFGPVAEAQAVARRLRAGCVTVNDLILATADPRLPFGGAGASGFGVTRGAEGLLEMTRPQAIVARRRPFVLPWRPLPQGAPRWIARMLRLLYG